MLSWRRVHVLFGRKNPRPDHDSMSTWYPSLRMSASALSVLKLEVVSETSDEAELWAQVRSAYLNLARETHPDKGGGEEAFRSVQSAFELLKRVHNEVGIVADVFSPSLSSKFESSGANVNSSSFTWGFYSEAASNTQSVPQCRGSVPGARRKRLAQNHRGGGHSSATSRRRSLARSRRPAGPPRRPLPPMPPVYDASGQAPCFANHQPRALLRPENLPPAGLCRDLSTL